jgi:hypothetical protein
MILIFSKDVALKITINVIQRITYFSSLSSLLVLFPSTATYNASTLHFRIT